MDVKAEIKAARTDVPKTASMKDAGGLSMAEVKGITSQDSMSPPYGSGSNDSSISRAVSYLNKDIGRDGGSGY